MSDPVATAIGAAVSAVVVELLSSQFHLDVSILSSPGGDLMASFPETLNPISSIDISIF